MRAITFKKDEFDDFVYPALATSSAENMQELEVAVRLMRKLSERNITEEEVITESRRTEADRQGHKVIPFRKLVSVVSTFHFEEDEWNLLRTRLEAYMPRVSLAAAERLYTLVSHINNTESE